jgi:hypothetical protein
MQLNIKVLCQMVGNIDGEEFCIILRHYCTQMYLNSLCTQDCVSCTPNLLSAFDFARGDFILNKKGALVFACREIVGDTALKAHEMKAQTPKNDLGEDISTKDPFTELMKSYETSTSLR